MANPQSNLDELMKDPKAAGLLKNKALLQSLMQSPDTQRLMELLSQNAGDGLKTAAAKGDTGALLGTLTAVDEYPASKVYTVKGEREILIPAVKDAFIRSVDLDGGRMEVKVWEGL